MNQKKIKRTRETDMENQEKRERQNQGERVTQNHTGRLYVFVNRNETKAL